MCFLKWSSGDCCAVSIESHGDRGRSILTEAPGDSHRLDILLSPIVICSLPLSKLSSFFFFTFSLVLLLIDTFGIDIALFF